MSVFQIRLLLQPPLAFSELQALDLIYTYLLGKKVPFNVKLSGMIQVATSKSFEGPSREIYRSVNIEPFFK